MSFESAPSEDTANPREVVVRIASPPTTMMTPFYRKMGFCFYRDCLTIHSVVPQSDAANAGLGAYVGWDVIELNETPVHTRDEFQAARHVLANGIAVELTLRRPLSPEEAAIEDSLNGDLARLEERPQYRSFTIIKRDVNGQKKGRIGIDLTWHADSEKYIPVVESVVRCKFCFLTISIFCTTNSILRLTQAFTRFIFKTF